MKAFLEHFAAILGAITATILAMSWSHEYGYFWTIGRQFQTFLTTSDYLTNGVLWLPLGILFVYQSITWRSLSVERPAKSDRKVWVTWALRGTYAIWFIGLLLTATWPIEYLSAVDVMAFVVIFWSMNWRGFYDQVKLEEPFQLISRELIRLGPPIIIGMFLYGSVNAESDLTRTSNVYLFKFKDVTNPQLLIFLRNFERGVLTRDLVQQRVVFLKWDDIKEISLITPEKSNSVLCWIIGWSCSEKYKALRDTEPLNP